MTGEGWVEWTGLQVEVKANQAQVAAEEERVEALQEVVGVAVGVEGPLEELGVLLLHSVLHFGEVAVLQEYESWLIGPELAVDV